MRFLHLCLDEKFIAFARKVYEAAWPGENHFLVYRADEGPVRHNLAGEAYECVGPRHFHSRAFEAQLAGSDCFVVHYLDADFVPVVAALPPGMKVIWHAWGADVYPLLGEAAPPLFLPETAALVAGLEAGRKRRLLANPIALVRLARRKWRYRRHLNTCLARFDLVSMAPAEFALLQRARPNVRAAFRHFHYNSVEDVFAKGPADMRGPNILLGNSADPSNNHLEALEALDGANMSGRRIICPLSYGGNEKSRGAYVAAVIAAGKQRFGDAFAPLTTFMPFEDYVRMLETCGTVVMNQVRQQAVGTIGMALYKGAGVYLRPGNLVADYFRELGCRLLELTEGVSFDARLDASQVAQNRAALEACYGFERIVDCVREYEGVLNSPMKP